MHVDSLTSLPVLHGIVLMTFTKCRVILHRRTRNCLIGNKKKNKNKLFTLNKTPVIRLLIATCTAWRDTYCEEEKNVLVPALNTAKKNSLPR